MTLCSIKKDALFSEGFSCVPLRLAGVWSVTVSKMGCGGQSLTMKPSQSYCLGKWPIILSKSALRYLFSLAVC